MKMNRLSKVVFVLGVFVIPFFADATTFFASRNYRGFLPGQSTSIHFIGVMPSTIGVNQVGQITGEIQLDTDAGYIPVTPQALHSCSGSCGPDFIESSNIYEIIEPCAPRVPNPPCATNTGTFTAPSVPGIYRMSVIVRSTTGNFSSSNGNVATPQINVVGSACSDSLNNDNAEGADTLDPQCHTDCNVNNAGSYVPTHNSETTPPNGTCPATPTLNLNGRAAFLQVVKNFFVAITAKAFAGE